jgi:hypothetical protein
VVESLAQRLVDLWGGRGGGEINICFYEPAVSHGSSLHHDAEKEKKLRKKNLMDSILIEAARITGTGVLVIWNAADRYYCRRSRSFLLVRKVPYPS